MNDTAVPSGGGSSLNRMLALLDAFTPARTSWDVESLAGRFGYTASSTYRYVNALCAAGLLMRLPRGRYVVGARVIDLEFMIRESDPVIRVGRPLLRTLARETGCHLLLSSVYGDHLINVLHEPGIEPLELTYVRGRALPWFRGAPGRAVLAWWPRARVRRLHETTEGLQAARGTPNRTARSPESPDLREVWDDVWRDLRAIRKAGYCVSRGGLDPDVVGYGAPVIVEGGADVIGSLSLVCSLARGEFLNERSVGRRLAEVAADIGRRLEAAET